MKGVRIERRKNKGEKTRRKMSSEVGKKKHPND